jgi:hypothetical protein
MIRLSHLITLLRELEVLPKVDAVEILLVLRMADVPHRASILDLQLTLLLILIHGHKLGGALMVVLVAVLRHSEFTLVLEDIIVLKRDMLISFRSLLFLPHLECVNEQSLILEGLPVLLHLPLKELLLFYDGLNVHPRIHVRSNSPSIFSRVFGARPPRSTGIG